MYRTEVKICTLSIGQWLEEYYRPEEFIESCKACPNYGQVWSCPPLPQATQQLVQPFSDIHIIAVKVIYGDEIRAAAKSAEQVRDIRDATYGKVKRTMLETLLEMEKAIPGSWCIAAGECELCDTCRRKQGLPCCIPEKMRYSFSGLGLDLTRIAQELLGIDLLWQREGLPEYNVAIAALLERKGKQMKKVYQAELVKPRQIFEREFLSILRQIGCKIRRIDGAVEQFEVIDCSTADQYALRFLDDEPQGIAIEFRNMTGSGRRMNQITECLLSQLPEVKMAGNDLH